MVLWNKLGLDLEAHDCLLNHVTESYRETFLSQKNRPQSMDYLDFVISEVHGLRIKELMDKKAAGQKVIGAFCVFVPEEIVQAVDASLVGLCTGADFSMEEVERFLPRNTCPLIKSAFGFKLGNVCPYIETADMIVGENTCDGKKKSYEVLKELIPNLYVMDIPQTKGQVARRLFSAEYLRFKDAVEELSGLSVNAERLKQGIEIVNKKRQAIHRLSRLRSADPAPISGLDALLVNQVYFYENPLRFADSVNRICDELEERISHSKGAFPKGAPRIIISGCPMALPNWKAPRLIESAGAVIVGEESCVGERGTRNLTESSGETLVELIEAIVDRYFKIDCAIFTPNPERLNHITEMVKEYKADGVILYNLQFCQPYLIESMHLQNILGEKGIPTLRIETDYSAEDIGQLKTRIEAFIELIK